jgi:integrase
VRALHAKGLVLEASARVLETQKGHAGRIERFVRFAQSRLGISRAVALPKHGPMPICLVVTFLIDLSQGGLVGGTFDNYVSTLNVWHTDRCLPPPAQHPELRKKLEGIRRRIGAAGGNVRRRKAPITLPLLTLMLHCLSERALQAGWDGVERFRCTRDAVALVLGFFGMLRKSELAAAKLQDLALHASHAVLKLPWSKVDQRRRGREQWFARRTRSGIEIGALLERYAEMLAARGFGPNDPFLPRISGGVVTRAHLPGKGAELAACVKALVEDVAGYAVARGVRLPLSSKDYASHSLRRGGLNHARQQGHSREACMVFGRWASDAIDDYKEWDDSQRIAFTACM